MPEHGDESIPVVPGVPPEIAKQLSSFMTKLIQMIAEPTTDSLISWTQEGKTFTVHHAAVLAEKVLPKYFKHKNFTSLVRQLNMYGFHKVVDQTTTLADKTSDQVWEFIHPCVHRDKPELLVHVKRKESSAQLKKDALKGDVESVMMDLHAVRSQQHLISSKFMEMQRLNMTLHQQVIALQSRHSRQQAQIGKIMEFLTRIVHDDGSTALGNGSATVSAPPAAKRSRVGSVGGQVSEASSAAAFSNAPPQLGEHHIAALDHHVQGVTDHVQSLDDTLSATRERLTAAGINPGVVHGMYHHDGDVPPNPVYGMPQDGSIAFMGTQPGFPTTIADSGLLSSMGGQAQPTLVQQPQQQLKQHQLKQPGGQTGAIGGQPQQVLYYPLRTFLGDHAHHDEAAPPSELDPLLTT